MHNNTITDQQIVSALAELRATVPTLSGIRKALKSFAAILPDEPVFLATLEAYLLEKHPRAKRMYQLAA